MKLITITLILLVVLFVFLFLSKKEHFNTLRTIGDDERIIPYKLSLNIESPLPKYSWIRFVTDSMGTLIDPNITGCDKHRQNFYKYNEPLGPSETPEEYKDKNGNTCQYYKENPEECLSQNASINSVEVTKSEGWFKTVKYKDSPRDACYIKESETDNDRGCSGGYTITPYVYKNQGSTYVYLYNSTNSTSLRDYNNLNYFPDTTDNNLKLNCYRVVKDLGYNKTHGKCGDSNKKHPNYKIVNIPGTERDYEELSRKCTNIHECQGFEIDKANARAKYFGDSPYFTNKGTDEKTIIENGDSSKDFECYKKKNFTIGEEYKVFSGTCTDSRGSQHNSRYTINTESPQRDPSELPAFDDKGNAIKETPSSVAAKETDSGGVSETPTTTGETSPTSVEKTFEEMLLDRCKGECDKIPECLGFTTIKDEFGEVRSCNLVGERPDWVQQSDWDTEYNISKISPLNLTNGTHPDILNRKIGDSDCYKKMKNKHIDDNFIITSGTCRGGPGLTSHPPITKSDGQTIETCKQKCLDHDACQGISYNDETNTCKFFGYMNESPNIEAADSVSQDRIHLQIERGNPMELDTLGGLNATPEKYKFEKCYKKINYIHFPDYAVSNGECNANGAPINSVMDNGEFKEDCAKACSADISCQGFTLDEKINTCRHFGYMSENPINTEKIIHPGDKTNETDKKCYLKPNFKPILKDTVHNSNQNHRAYYGKCRASDGDSFPPSYTLNNILNVSECADKCGNSRETPNNCQGFDYDTVRKTCTFYGNDTEKYIDVRNASMGSQVLNGNRDVDNGKQSICFINNKYTPVNTEILK